MYGFLILLPMTLVSVLIGALLLWSPQLADYVDFITNFNWPDNINKWQFFIENKRFWSRIAAHVVAYIIVCFALLATVRTVSNPLPAERWSGTRWFQIALECIFVTIPSSVLLWICARALWIDQDNPLLWLTIVVLVAGLITCVWVTARRSPIELYASSFSPVSVTKTDGMALFVICVMVATVVAFAVLPRESADVVGMFPVLMLATAAAFLAAGAIFSRFGSPIAIISTLITAVLALHVIDQLVPRREFRHASIAWQAKGERTEPEAIKQQRNVPRLPDAFREWLEHRRPAIDAYAAAGRVYPIFFVSAQGGGMYAAYHPALTLARITDACPEFAHHLFGISSVSGGSLGAAVYAEALRALPSSPLDDPASAKASCTDRGDITPENTPLGSRVQTFFANDLLSPVVASAFIFDVPSLFVPQLRYGQDRARALESGIEAAWEASGSSQNKAGMAADFYGRWKPKGNVPALFMSTTGVEFGVPILVSQVDFGRAVNVNRRQPTRAKTRDIAPATEGADTRTQIDDQFRRTADATQTQIGNVLDFRPDVQIATSTAAVLSARFPFVTPPGVVKEDPKIKKLPLYQNTKYLELTDGGFFDNSGGEVARQLINQMQSLLNTPNFSDFKGRVGIRWIRFTDTPQRRQVAAGEGGNPEIVSPLIAFNSVRLSRGALLATPPAGVRVFNLYLLDEWYEGTLNWLLSQRTRTDIEIRSSWIKGTDNNVCCLVTKKDSPNETRRIPLTDEQVAALSNSGYEFQRIRPNEQEILDIIDAVNKGLEPPKPAASPATSIFGQQP